MMDVLAQTLAAAGTTLMGRLSAPELGNQPVRRRLLALIEQQPGMHASQLCREAGEPWGTVQYHLSLLHKGALVTAVDAGRERRFFPTEMDPARAQLLALLHQGRRMDVARFIQQHAGARQVDICDALDLSRKTFRHAVDPLVEQGFVNERKGLSSSRYFPQDALAGALATAASASPSEAAPEGPAAPTFMP